MGSLHRSPGESGEGDAVTTLDVAELLSEVRALRHEIAEIKLGLAEERGRDLGRQVADLAKRVNALELWRAALVGLTTAAGISSVGALFKLFGG
jgi:hypothetical protein